MRIAKLTFPLAIILGALTTVASAAESTVPPESADQLVEERKEPGMARKENISDAALNDKIRAALAAEPTLEDSRLNIESRDGSATITGTVKGAADQETIATIVRKLDGVLTVHVDVKVEP